jgi:general secretion pathway protein G
MEIRFADFYLRCAEGRPYSRREIMRASQNSRDRFLFRRGRGRGFTLVELMVVIVIIGLLATVAIVNLLPKAQMAKRQVAKAHMKQLEQAIELFYLDQGRLPASLQDLVVRPGSAKEWPDGGYLKEGSLPKDPWQGEYIYRIPGTNRKYDLICTGADGAEGGDGDNADIKLYDDVQK